MRAMILSAGYGTRLWPLTEDRTKPAIPILGKPLVATLRNIWPLWLARYTRKSSSSSGFCPPALGDGSQFGVKLQYVDEP